jgi:hypothetical protein
MGAGTFDLLNLGTTTSEAAAPSRFPKEPTLCGVEGRAFFSREL